MVLRAGTSIPGKVPALMMMNGEGLKAGWAII